jgi:hypothetical protein
VTWVSPIDALLTGHRWDGGPVCSCGSDAASLEVWGRHVVVEAWAKFTVIGAEAERVRQADAS